MLSLLNMLTHMLHSKSLRYLKKCDSFLLCRIFWSIFLFFIEILQILEMFSNFWNRLLDVEIAKFLENNNELEGGTG